jgi:hypothetical protein
MSYLAMAIEALKKNTPYEKNEITTDRSNPTVQNSDVSYEINEIHEITRDQQELLVEQYAIQWEANERWTPEKLATMDLSFP